MSCSAATVTAGGLAGTLNGGYLGRALGKALLVAGGVAAVAWAAPALTSTGLARFFRPFGGPAWPAATFVQVTPGRTTEARGDELTISALVRGRVPETVTLERRDADGVGRMTARTERGGRAAWTLRSVRRPFRYAVRAVTAGTFVLPAAEASCMYDPGLYSVHGRGVVTIK